MPCGRSCVSMLAGWAAVGRQDLLSSARCARWQRALHIKRELHAALRATGADRVQDPRGGHHVEAAGQPVAGATGGANLRSVAASRSAGEKQSARRCRDVGMAWRVRMRISALASSRAANGHNACGDRGMI